MRFLSLADAPARDLGRSGRWSTDETLVDDFATAVRNVMRAATDKRFPECAKRARVEYTQLRQALIAGLARTRR